MQGPMPHMKSVDCNCDEGRQIESDESATGLWFDPDYFKHLGSTRDLPQLAHNKIPDVLALGGMLRSYNLETCRD